MAPATGSTGETGAQVASASDSENRTIEGTEAMTATTTQPDTTELTTLRSIREQVLSLATTADADTMRSVIARYDWAKAFIKELGESLEQAEMEWIEANGDLELDDTRRLYIGTEKKTKARDTKPLVEALLTATGGDMDEFCKLLASGWVKPGACKPVLGDDYDTHFETTEVPDVKTGSPKRSVKMIDSRFVK